MMSEAEMMEELRRTRRLMQFQTVGIFLFAGLMVFLMRMDEKTGPTIENTASPEFSNSVSSGSELDHIKDRAERRGYYTRLEFAEVMDVSESKVDRWRASGWIESQKMSNGEIRIPLDARVVSE